MTQPVDRSGIPVNIYPVLVIGVLAISSAAILIRLAQAEGVPSLLIAGARLSIAAVLLTLPVLRRYSRHIRQLRQRDLMLALTSGLFLALHFATWVTSLEYTSVLVSVVFVTTSPLWVALLEVVFLRATLPRSVIIGLLIAIAGGLVIGFAGTTTEELSRPGQNDLLGGGLSLAGALAVSVYLIIGRRLRVEMPLIPYIWLVYGCAGVLLMLAVIFTGIPVTGYSSSAYLLLIALAVLPQLIGHTSLNYAIGYVPATLVSMVTQLEPAGSAILAFFFLNEIPMPLQVIGSAIILGGVFLANIGQARHQRKQKRLRDNDTDTDQHNPA